jgi:hypothetical protein
LGRAQCQHTYAPLNNFAFCIITVYPTSSRSWEDVLGAWEHYVAKSEIGRKITELKEMSNLADEAAKEQDKQKEREGKRLAKVVAGAAKIAGQEAANAFEVTLQRAKDEKAAEEMELEEKDFKQELGITEGKCASP